MPKSVSKIIIWVIGSLLLIQMLFDPISIVGNYVEKSKVQRELAKAQKLWNDIGAENYKIKVRGAVPLACVYDALLTVQNGQLVKVESRAPFNEKSEYKMVEKENWNTHVGCDYTRLTLSQVLYDVSDALANTNPLTQKPKVTFDSRNGFVTYYQINYHGYGLFTSSLVRDCCSWYEFSNYEPIEQ